jgi:AhpD family alkylhydroperoxidase
MRELSDETTEGALKAGVEEEIIHLVKVRVSQLNGCAYCVDMHTIDAQAAGVTNQRMHMLTAWRHCGGFYGERERAALDLAESITQLDRDHVGEAVYHRAIDQFGQEQVGYLIFIATVMNAWNRLAIAGRLPAGSYQGRHS